MGEGKGRDGEVTTLLRQEGQMYIQFDETFHKTLRNGRLYQLSAEP